MSILGPAPQQISWCPSKVPTTVEDHGVTMLQPIHTYHWASLQANPPWYSTPHRCSQGLRVGHPVASQLFEGGFFLVNIVIPDLNRMINKEDVFHLWTQKPPFLAFLGTPNVSAAQVSSPNQLARSSSPSTTTGRNTPGRSACQIWHWKMYLGLTGCSS